MQQHFFLPQDPRFGNGDVTTSCSCSCSCVDVDTFRECSFQDLFLTNKTERQAYLVSIAYAILYYVPIFVLALRHRKDPTKRTTSQPSYQMLALFCWSTLIGKILEVYTDKIGELCAFIMYTNCPGIIGSCTSFALSNCNSFYLGLKAYELARKEDICHRIFAVLVITGSVLSFFMNMLWLGIRLLSPCQAILYQPTASIMK